MLELIFVHQKIRTGGKVSSCRITEESMKMLKYVLGLSQSTQFSGDPQEFRNFRKPFRKFSRNEAARVFLLALPFGDGPKFRD